VIAYTTYASKYFNPHFLETLLFEKTGDGWRLLRQTLVPVVRTSPEDLKVEIYLAAPQPDLFEDFAKISLAKGADHWVDLFLQRRRDWILTDRRKTSVLFVFREPPPVGAKITIEHSWKSRTVVHPPPEKLYYVVKRSQPYYVIENESWVGCCAGDSATYKVYVNGIKVAEKTVVARK